MNAKILLRLIVGIAVMVFITRATGGTRWLNARDDTAAGDPGPWWLLVLCVAFLGWAALKKRSNQ